MSSLAEPLAYGNLLASYLSSTPGLAIVKRLAWYGLAPDTKKGYSAAINSYVSFYALYSKEPWPTKTTMLEEWIANRIFRSTLPKQGQVKPDTVLSYLSALKSYHIDKRISLKGFDKPRIAFIIKGGKRLFFSKKRNRLPISKDILKKITKNELHIVTQVNINTVLKVA